MNIVEKQLLAFNEKDIETFLSCYSEDIVVKMLETDQVLANGKDELKEIMNISFTSEKSSSTGVINRISQGEFIIDKERIIGHKDGKIITSLAIYQIKNQKIERLWFCGRSIEQN